MEWHSEKINFFLPCRAAMAFSMLVLLVATCSGQLFARVLPAEGSKLHYRLISFSAPQFSAGGKYNIEIASGSYGTEDSFKKAPPVQIRRECY